jgi:hypothetical protein
MQKRKYSCLTIFPRLYTEILVHYENFLGWQGKEPEFVGTGKLPTLRTSRDDIPIIQGEPQPNDEDALH